MNRIGALSIPSSEIIDSIIKEWVLTPSKAGYVAPTVYMPQGITHIPGINYYDTAAKAFSKLKYLENEAGGKNETASGFITLKKDGTAQTVGINCDFFIAISAKYFINVPYGIVRLLISKGIKFSMFFRFYTIHGAGPYYAVFNKSFLNIAATTTKSYSAEKIKAMDEMYRQVNLMKANYNGIVATLNRMASLPSLTASEQQIYNRGNNLRVSMLSDIQSQKHLEVAFTKDGGIGALPLIPIVWFAIAAIVASWATSKIVASIQATKRINDSYSFLKWKEEEEKNIAILEQQGKISKENATAIRTGLDRGAVAAGEVIKESSEDKSMFGDIGEVLKWGALLFVAITVLPKIGGSSKK